MFNLEQGDGLIRSLEHGQGVPLDFLSAEELFYFQGVLARDLGQPHEIAHGVTSHWEENVPTRDRPDVPDDEVGSRLSVARRGSPERGRFHAVTPPRCVPRNTKGALGLPACRARPSPGVLSLAA